VHGLLEDGVITAVFQLGQRTSSGAVSPISPKTTTFMSTDVCDFQDAVVFWKHGILVANETDLALWQHKGFCSTNAKRRVRFADVSDWTVTTRVPLARNHSAVEAKAARESEAAA